MEKTLIEFTKYEKARILGARALQISMDAPVLLKLSKEELESLNYDSLKIAQQELERGILPIAITRPLPEKKESKLRIIKKESGDSVNGVEEGKKLDSEDEIVQELEQEFESDSEDYSSSNSESE
jgi:DNA-directed RNA polymerase subunit K